jgi:lysophospholipase L1-like esterase
MPAAGKPQPSPEHNITKALSLAPNSIIINLPSNDQFFGFTTAEQLENYERVAALAEAAGVALWVTTSQPRNFADPADLQALFEAKDAIVARFGEKSIDFWTDLAEADGTIRPELDSGDGIHLNDAAHAILADRVIAEDIPLSAKP